MNKYELALVVSAKVEDEVRDAVVDKAKGYITRYNGTITEVEELSLIHIQMCIRDRYRPVRLFYPESGCDPF